MCSETVNPERTNLSPIQFGPAVLVGYGSIGQYHARLLHGLYEILAVVDQNDAARDGCLAKYPDVMTAASLADLDRTHWPWDQTLAVIATWGPSHSAIFHQLVELGVRKILCEKPLAHSIAAGAEMVRVAKKHNIAFGNHNQRQYSGFVENLRKKADELNIGNPRSMVIEGGASGLVTNGIHHLALASSLFGQAPEWVMSTAKGLPINPRSPSLTFFGGTATWSYGEGRELTMTMSNHSSISPSISIYYRDAKLQLLRNMEVAINLRDPEQLEQYPAITRLGEAVVNAFQGSLPEVLPPEECTKLLLSEIELNDVRTYPPESALETLSACIGALASGATGKRITLPIHPEGETGTTEWQIS